MTIYLRSGDHNPHQAIIIILIQTIMDTTSKEISSIIASCNCEIRKKIEEINANHFASTMNDSRIK